MRATSAWLLWLTLLASSASQAQLRLTLDTRQLTQKEQQASQVLLGEASNLLPPRLREAIDRPVRVAWSQLPEQVYGRASRSNGIELNASLLPSLVDGSAAHKAIARPHATQRRELLATLLHEIVHLYDRGAYWSSSERRLLHRCQQ